MPAGTSISIPSIFILGMTISGSLGREAAGLPLGDAPFHLRAEMADQALDRPGRRVAQGADRVALDLLGDVVQHIDLLDARVTLDHAFQHPPHPAGALAARRALAAALVLVEVAQPRDRLDHVS